MVLPLIAGLAGAGASIYGSVLGGQAQDDATMMNWYINQENNRQRNKERRELIQYSEDVRDDEKLGGTDALGNRSYFKEGVGWVSELSPEQQQLYDYFYGQELPELRSKFKRDASRSREDNMQANSLLDEFQRITKGDPRSVESLLYQVGSKGIGEGTAEVLEKVGRDGIRSGASNTGQIIADVARENMDARRDAKLNAKLQAKDYVDQRYANDRQNSANLYNSFVASAGKGFNPSYDPSGVPQAGNALLSQFVGAAQAGKQIGAQAYNKQGGTLDYIEPATGVATAIGNSGNVIASLGDRAGSYFDKQKNNGLFQQYLQQGNNTSFDGGGIFGNVTDRVRANGAF